MTIQFYTAGATISMAPMIEGAGAENNEANGCSFKRESRDGKLSHPAASGNKNTLNFGYRGVGKFCELTRRFSASSFSAAFETPRER
jgi:hypothetical protein